VSETEQYQEMLIWEYFNRQPNGFFIEVGANHPTGGSLTWFLEQRNWEGILIEPQQKLFALLQKLRPRSHVFRAACSSPDKVGVSYLHLPKDEALNGFATLEKNIDDHEIAYGHGEQVDVVTLDSIIHKVSPQHIDLLTIDTEGTELDVLKGLDFSKHRPSLILVEDKGRSLEKHRFLKQNGYALVKRTELNNWYVPQGTRFHMTSFTEWIKLWRKVFLGLPFRQFRHWRHSRRAQGRHRSVDSTAAAQSIERRARRRAR
jgi:FkbM family methyltransferase